MIVANSTMATSIEPKYVIIIKYVFISLFIFLSLFGNGCVIYIVVRNKRMRSVPNLFILNLAVADVFFALTGMPTILVTTYHRQWILGKFICNVTGVLNSLFCTVSIWTLVMISVNRLIAVARPFQLKVIYTRTNTYWIIFGTWVISLQFAYAPLFGWGEITPGDNYCTINAKQGMSYAAVYIVICFVTPGIVLPVIYLLLIHLIKKQLNIRRKISNYGRDPQPTTSTKKTVEDNFKLVKMISVVVIGFFICWTPGFIGSILYGFNVNTGSFHTITLGVMFACLNSVINPFIYAAMNSNFKIAYLDIFHKLKRKVKFTSREYEKGTRSSFYEKNKNPTQNTNDYTSQCEESNKEQDERKNDSFHILIKGKQSETLCSTQL